MIAYEELLERKRRIAPDLGMPLREPSSVLFDWQRSIVSWAARKGRAAIFADCGLGKTLMQIDWASSLGKRTLIVAPLCVTDQTAREAAKLGITAHYATDQSHASGDIVLTNYERIDGFDADEFGAVVLDESSILKSFDGKTRTKLIQKFASTPYRLCCTATPAPNDISELANHVEFLGLMTRGEFLATWFVHDDEGWRMKGHAGPSLYRWMTSWAVALRLPSDIGFEDADFVLPPLHINQHEVSAWHPPEGMLFPMLAAGVKGRHSARKASVRERAELCASIVEANTGQSIVWCGLNEEARMVASLIPGAVNVEGNDTFAEKVAAASGFIDGAIRTLVSKPRIFGFGMNFQNCSHMVFLGLGDSYEQYYQCLRRCWRFGQKSPVVADVVTSQAEHAVVENIKRKEKSDASMRESLVKMMGGFHG